MSGEITVGIGSKELRARIQALAAVDRDVAKAWRAEAKAKIAVPWAAELATFAPRGRKGDAAGRSIQAAAGQKPAIVAGKGSWAGDHGDPWQPFFLMEFGGYRGDYTTYTRRRKGGGAVPVRRRTKTWALPHRARGYWFRKALNRTQPKYRDVAASVIDEFIRGRL